MANTSVIRLAGKTSVIAVTATSSTAISITSTTNNQINYASFLNAGAKPCAVNVSSLATAPAAVFPTAGTPGDYVLPGNMVSPVVLAVPTAPFSVTAICGGTDTTTLYVTAADDQS